MFSGCLEMDGGPGALETDCYFCLWYCHAWWYLVQWVTLVWHPPASQLAPLQHAAKNIENHKRKH